MVIFAKKAMKLRHPCVLEFLTLHKILKCDNSNESYWAVLLPPVLFIMLYKVVLPFESMDGILMSDQFKWKLLRSTFVPCCSLCCTRWFQLSKLQLLKYLHVNTQTPLHEKHIKEFIQNNLTDLTIIYILYYFAGWNTYSTFHTAYNIANAYKMNKSWINWHCSSFTAPVTCRFFVLKIRKQRIYQMMFIQPSAYTFHTTRSLSTECFFF